MPSAETTLGPPIVAVIGATASGKTALSLDLAEALGGEIVNTDAMQVYRGMDNGTAKLPVDERRDIPHHLLDLLSVDQVASVAEFQRMAREVIADVRTRGRVPVLVGGSALYTRAILDRFDFPGTDPDVRRALEAELDSRSAEVLWERLKGMDPQAAQGILPSNGRRIVRALEVMELTGRPFSATLPTLDYHFAGVHQIGVDIDRPTLDRRISERVDTMFAQGFVDEVTTLMGQGLRGSLTASRAIGYREVIDLIDGSCTEAVARERTKTATRRFARRQDSWFRKDPRITWLDWNDPELAATATAAVRRGVQKMG